MRTLTLDVRHIDTVAALQRYIQFAMDFPEHYGRNLDALHDMLCEMDRCTRIVLVADAAVSDELTVYLPRLAQVIEDAATENGNLSFEKRIEK